MKPHKDFKDLSWGWCTVTSFGDYDHTKGGHLILWDLKIAIEFPPHSTIFIPSTIVEHSNTATQLGEARSTIMQYNSAGLFCWVAEFDVEPEPWWAKLKYMFSRVY